jgi:anti-sigma B factor antagonist
VVAEHVDDFAVAVQRTASETVVTVRGELDMATTPELRATLAEVLAFSPDRLVVDAHLLTFVDSTGLSALMLAERRCRIQGGQLVLRDPTPVLRRLIDLAGVEAVLQIETS